MKSRFIIRPEDLEPPSLLPPEYVRILNSPLDAFELVSGGPCTGKTFLALLKAKRLVDAGNRCLFIAGNSLSLKYIKREISFLSSQNIRCSSFFEATKYDAIYDVIILDDSQQYSLEQIHALSSSARFLLLFGDYYHCQCATTIDEITRIFVGCRVYSLSIPFGIPYEFLRLIPRSNNVAPVTSVRQHLPAIVRIGSIEEQCLAVKQLVDSHVYDNVGILCYTRNLVKEALASFNKLGLIVEAYLPGRKDGIDTLDPGSSVPKLTTIASAYGIHFHTVFVIGFDSEIVWNNSKNVIEKAITRATNDLYVFYNKKLPEPLDSIPQSYYKTFLYNNNTMEL